MEIRVVEILGKYLLSFYSLLISKCLAFGSKIATDSYLRIKIAKRFAVVEWLKGLQKILTFLGPIQTKNFILFLHNVFIIANQTPDNLTPRRVHILI